MNQNGPLVVTPPVAAAVKLDVAKAYCLITGTKDDALVGNLVSAATDYVQRRTGQQLAIATLKQTWDDFVLELILDIDPVQSVSSVKYYDAAGTLTTISPTNYWVDTEARRPRIFPRPGFSWPQVQSDRPAAVQVAYVAGYSVAATIPQGLIVAILTLVKHWYVNRIPVLTTGIGSQPISHGLDALLCLHDHTGYN